MFINLTKIVIIIKIVDKKQEKTRIEEPEFHIDTAKIECIGKHEGMTIISTDSNGTHFVKESVKEVLEKVNSHS